MDEIKNGNAPENEISNEMADFSEEVEVAELDAEESESTENEAVNEINGSMENTVSETVVPASKKTTIVLISTIIVLIAVIAVFAVLFVKQYKENKAISAGNDISTSQSTSDAVTTDSTSSTSTSTDVSGVSSSAVNELDEVNYDVTVTLGQYKGIEVDYQLEEITEDDIQAEIDTFTSSYAEEVEVTDRAVQFGDVVNIDFTGYLDDELFDGGADTDYDLEIGSDTFIDGFEEGLVGANLGDTIDVNVTFPDPYPNNTDLSGKPVKFVVTINSITEYITPEFTDELVAANSDYATTEEFIQGAREMLEGYAIEDADALAKSEITKKLIENTTYTGDIETEIADQLAYYLNYYDSMASSYYGVDGATLFYYMYGWSAEEYNQYMTDEVTFSIKYNYALEEIAKVENLEVSDEEYQALFQEYFIDYYGFESEEEVYESYDKATVQELINNMALSNKAEDIVLDSAIINK